MSLPRIGTAIVHYRCLEDTRRCLRSLRALDYPAHRTLLVDNASEDGSVPVLSREFPDVPLVALQENLGYAGGNNRAIERLLAEGADLIQILNPDVELVEPGYLRRMAVAFETHPDWGAAGPLVYFRDRSEAQTTWLAFPSVARIVRESLAATPPSVPPEDVPGAERVVDAVVGACLLLRAEAVREVGGFNEALFMYGEEVDLCWRLRRAGWKTGLVPAPSFIHHTRTTAESFGLAHDLCRSNQVRFLRWHRGRASAGTAALWLAATGLLKAAVRGGEGVGRYLSDLASAAAGRPARPPAR